MPAKRIKRSGTANSCFHIYNAGIDGRVIFNDSEDYDVFVGFLQDYLTTLVDRETTKKEFTVNGRVFSGVPHQPKNYFDRVDLLAYCLLPDHFHLLVQQKAMGALEKFLRSLCTRYSIYFNKKYQRSGALFGGRYRSVEVNDDAARRLLTRYFHQVGGYHPVPPSSYPEYLGKRQTPWVRAVMEEGYQDFVEKQGLTQAEHELLERSVFESEAEHLGGHQSAPSGGGTIRRHLGGAPYGAPWEDEVKPRGLGVAEFVAVAAAAVFVLLVGVGYRSVQVHAAKQSAGAVATNSEARNPEVLHAVTEHRPQVWVVVEMESASQSANIRQNPTVASAKIGKAKDGESFELVAHDSAWYEIKLADNLTGFIAEEYVKEQEGGQ